MKQEYDFGDAKRGATLSSKGKTRITIYLDDEVIEEFRDRSEKAGFGYQTMINQALREFLGRSRRALDEDTLRRVLREELRTAS